MGTRHNASNLFGGWMICGKNGCGCKISFHRHKKGGKDYEHYICANGKKAHLSLRGMYVSEQQVFDQFEGALDAITITDAMAADVRSALAASHLATMEKQKRQAATYCCR
jgi:hypothetical protein